MTYTLGLLIAVIGFTLGRLTHPKADEVYRYSSQIYDQGFEDGREEGYREGLWNRSWK